MSQLAYGESVVYNPSRLTPDSPYQSMPNGTIESDMPSYSNNTNRARYCIYPYRLYIYKIHLVVNLPNYACPNMSSEGAWQKYPGLPGCRACQTCQASRQAGRRGFYPHTSAFWGPGSVEAWTESARNSVRSTWKHRRQGVPMSLISALSEQCWC